ncbi:MAG: type II secretion system F family protein, partial [Candidatus Diapherotrites archaeon]|nr:type II secretion system F family protein [Candidatus Diapherotrites archaeon]
AVSAIVPALFESFILVGSLFLDLDFSAIQVLAIMAVGFPLLDLGVLMYIRSQMPVFLRSDRSQRKDGAVEWVERVLHESGGGVPLSVWVRKRAMEGIGMGVVLASAALVLHPAYLYITCGLLAGFLLPAFVSFCICIWTADSRRRQKEEAVCDVLLQASTFPTGTPTLVILTNCARSDFGLLGLEFARAQDQLQKGASVEEALSDLAKRCDSRVVDWAVRLILLSYSTGTDLSTSFRQAAEDLLETQSILRERGASLLVEKYTILFAGGILVPVVLGLLSSMVGHLDWSAFSQLDLGTTAATRLDIRDAAVLGIQLYLVEYAVIAGLFVGNQEGNLRRGLLYATVLVPVGLIAFWLAKGG